MNDSDSILDDPQLDPRFLAAIDMLYRTGATMIQVRWSDDVVPEVWFVVAEHRIQNGRPALTGRPVYDAAAGMTPLSAAMRLCAQLVDGGRCAHCNRPAGFSEDFDRMPLDDQLCWYQWDPELATFRRGCEGRT